MMNRSPVCRTLCAAAVATLLATSSSWSQAELTPQDIERLGKELTPVGAERAGNAAGTIPAWEGGLTKPPAGFDSAKGYTDVFAAEKPLYTITAANAETYRDKLPPGQ